MILLKKLLIALLIITNLLVLVGCGKQEVSQTVQPEQPKQEQPKQEQPKEQKKASFGFEEIQVINPGKDNPVINYPQLTGLLRNNTGKKAQNIIIQAVVRDIEKNAIISQSISGVTALEPGEAAKFRIGFIELNNKPMPSKWEIKIIDVKYN